MADLSNPVDQIESGQAAKEVTANELFDAASPAMIFGRRAETCAGLVWGYYGGRYRGVSIAHGTQTVTANQANIYMVAAKSTGVVSFSTGTTNWNDSTNYDRLYWMSTGPTTITDWDDYREVVSSAGAGVATIDTETIQDIVGALIVAGSNVTVTYNDASSPATITIASSGGGGSSLTQEQIEDIVGSLITAGTGITRTYNDADSPATLVLAVSTPKVVQVAASNETTALTTGTAKVTFRMPYAMTLTEVRGSLTTSQNSGSIFTVDINHGGTTVLSTKLTIDNTEKTSVFAATPAVISVPSLTDDDEITIDIDQVGDGTATGLKITLIGT